MLDINVIVNGQTRLNLEMQVINYQNWKERSLSYLCRSFDNVFKGHDYIEVAPVIQISFLALCESGYNNSTEYDLFVRCLSEQTIVENENRRLRTKEDGGMNSAMMQNPSDPEATFRNKAGKEHRGYAANLEESVGANGSFNRV